MWTRRSSNALRKVEADVSFEPLDTAPEPAARAIASGNTIASVRPAARAPESERPEGREGAGEVAQAAADKPARRKGRKRLVTLIAALAVGLGAWYGHYWWTVGRFMVSTDDAYVGVHAATVSAKVSGYVAAVEARDNEDIHAGDVIARIDDGDYQLAVDAARDKIASQQAAIARIGQQIAAQEASVDATKAQLASAQAVDTRTGLELKRQLELNQHQFASQQALEQAQAAREQAIASVQAARANVEAAETNVGVLKAQKEEAARALKELRTALAKAERDLSFTVIRAPFDGVIGNRAVQIGEYVQPGQRLASLVPLNDVYIDANFKETQLKGLKVGQPAAIEVDALPEHDIEGSVASMAPASGSVFSLLPPDNATGNFTKIVQRIPVRIRVPAALAKQELLRPGMSVVVSVNTKPGAAEPFAAGADPAGAEAAPLTTSSIGAAN